MDRIHEIQNKIYEAIVKVFLLNKTDIRERDNKFYCEEREVDSIIFERAKEIEDMMESWILEDQKETQ